MRGSFLLVVILSLSFPSLLIAGPIDECQEYAAVGVPGTSGDLLCRKGFLLSHDSQKKTPSWVAEHLTKAKAKGALERKNSFKADPGLPVGKRSELKDYAGSVFDRGHMAPAADMKWDKQAMDECFYLSNMVPQVGKGMNQGIWRMLEEKVRQWALKRGEVYIYTGPVYDPAKTETIGLNRVAVPVALYKVVFDPKTQEAIAFMMPNRPLVTKDMPKYIVSVREVENATGLDFFNTFNRATQDSIEVGKATSIWN